MILSQETYSVGRQFTHQSIQDASDWVSVTTLSTSQTTTEQPVRLGRQRWDLESQGYLECGYRPAAASTAGNAKTLNLDTFSTP
jgi:hypothetical protein